MVSEIVTLGLLLFTLPAESPTGDWNLTIRVGHRGEGLGTVVLEVKEKDETYSARLTSMQNRMVDADEVIFEDDTLTVVYGSYRYELGIEADTATGTVASPAGTEEVTAKRQATQLFSENEPPAYQKRWSGRIEAGDGRFAVVTRHHTFGFTNGDAFRDELEGMVGQEVEITGFLRVDRIEIQKIELRSPR